MDTQQIAADNLLFLTVSGSHAYGMQTPTSDTDLRGIFYAPKNVIVSAFKNIEQVEQFAGEKDSVVYELRKFIKLVSDINPNILELLWVEEDDILRDSEPYKILRQNRDLFLSSRAKFTFSGYAMSQLKRIRGHNKWISNPQPARRPKEVDFLSVVWNRTLNKEWNKMVPLTGVRAYELGSDMYGLLVTLNEEWIDKHEAIISHPLSEASDEQKKLFGLIVKFNRQLYKEAVDNWQHYWIWKKERNESRSELEEKYGYDTKHAAHLIRLLRMGVEILRGEGVKVRRPDAQELLAIRNGSLTYEQLLVHAEDLNKELDFLYETTKLPHSVDYEKADKLLQDLYYFCWTLESKDLKSEYGIGYKNSSNNSTNS